MAANRYDSSYTGIEHDTYVTKSLLVDLIYPVGSIYISLNNTNPTALFGGSWEAVQDRFLLGAGNSYNGNATGGEATHILTLAETPAHTHTRGTMDITGWAQFDPTIAYIRVHSVSGCFTRSGSQTMATGGAASETTNLPIRLEMHAANSWTGSTSSVGGGAAHNNMPPYLAVYMWKRIA